MRVSLCVSICLTPYQSLFLKLYNIILNCYPLIKQYRGKKSRTKSIKNVFIKRTNNDKYN